ncbi:hypothetical protein [Flavobacterium taihuense]|uniref:Lipoprotein n=1 Tax=Flavobacterium taihuense TaxID=2857508 RepID=A0ABS6XQG1_9FLAO|nr:hypothetical protein [Flavobacterium taihuense]MBW4358925.1 hypothetical protein [Flavobacterium taihuense]
MKKYFYFALGSVFLFSCNNETKNPDSAEIEDSVSVVSIERYQTEIFQTNADEYTAVTVNKLTGKVFIGKNAAGWYEATNAESIPAYDIPTYSISVFKGPDSSAQVALLDSETGKIYMYIVGHTANFYNTNIPLETLEKASN